jgi:hypothetical protein
MLGQGLALGVPRRRSSIPIVKAIVIPPYDSPASGGVLDIITSSLLFSGVSGLAICLLLGHGMPNNTCMFAVIAISRRKLIITLGRFVVLP